MSSLEKLQEEIGFYGKSPQVEELVQTIVTVAPTDLSVLLIGESGTGKEVIANAIHRLSKRKDKPLISVNCGAIPEGILESELFGHEKGSFTGAIGQKKGYFEAANKGTIFLDEIGEMPLNTQVKLLRVLETSEIMRVGGTESFKVDVRIIAATNKDLEKAVQRNEFRRDLYFRLKAITLKIPPLRKRKQDIPILVKKFTQDYVSKNNIEFKGFAPEAVDVMLEYDWPGNVRELKNFVETAIILNRGEVIRPGYVRSALNLEPEVLTGENLPVPLNKTPEQAERELIYRTLISLKLDISELKQMMKMLMDQAQQAGQNKPASVLDIIRNRNSGVQPEDQEVQPTTLSAMERELIKETLKKYGGSRRKTARALQISERTLYRKLHEYGLS
ncbi:MAG TPA: sigma-54-dependent Fis family transcriptional regulator [Caldithrix abyssi]|uniref:Sigma-54-dependent Fis family transcriptional regulator n=1 Tax=Caldithrix abyssi TaxID=187145 RepID=A0A7V5PPY8_CALAY|nr:sigma-54-dependent Fis family transcriptional regulator [Caldithrix abyssi]